MDLSNYPYIIAHSYKALRTEPEAQQRFHLLIRSFSLTLKFTTSVILREYLDRTEGFNPQLDQCLANGVLLRPSLQDFAVLMRLLLENRVSVLITIDDPVQTDFFNALDRLVELRNWYGDFEVKLNRVSWSRLNAEAEKCLQTVLSALSSLANGKLLLKSQYVYHYCQEITRIDYIELPHTGFFWYSKNTLVELYPLVVNRHERPCQYEGLYGSTLLFTSNDQTIIDTEDDQLRDAVLAIGRSAQQRLSLKTHRSPTVNKLHANDWTGYFNAAWYISDRILNQRYKEEGYRTEIFAPRRNVQQRIDDFLSSEQKLFILNGHSGNGKTFFMCRLTQQLLDQKHIVFHFYGGEFGEVDVLARIADSLQQENLPFNPEVLQQLEPQRQQRQLIVLVDAINEYHQPKDLFCRLVASAKQTSAFPWLKIILSCRSTVWQMIEPGFNPNYDLVYNGGFEGSSRPFVEMSEFDDEELHSAWQAWKNYQTEINHQNLDIFDQQIEQCRHILRRPIIFRYFLLSDHKKINTPEQTLLDYFDHLATERQARLQSLIKHLWNQKTDYLLSSDYAADPAVAAWLCTDRSEFSVAVFGCPDETHRHDGSRNLECDQRQVVEQSMCSLCREPLIPLKNRRTTIRRPLDDLLYEGILSRQSYAEGHERLRFEFDLLYETLTADLLASCLCDGSLRLEAVPELVATLTTPETAATAIALQTALLIVLNKNSERGKAILTSVAATLLDRQQQSFLSAVLNEWIRRAPTAAQASAYDTLLDAKCAWEQKQQLNTGLTASLLSLSNRLAQENLSAEPTQTYLHHLIDIACSPKYLVDWARIPDAARQALAATHPGDIAVRHLFDICRQQLADPATSHNDQVLQIVRTILLRLHGIGGTLRHRQRLAAIMEWLLRLAVEQVQNRALLVGIVQEVQQLLASLPLLRWQTGMRRHIRALILHLASRLVLIPVANRSLGKLFANIPAELRQYPGQKIPFSRLFHLPASLAPQYRRLVALLENPSQPLTDDDIDMCKSFERIPFDEAFRPLLSTTEGSTLSIRCMLDFPGHIAAAEKFVARLEPGEEFAGNDLIWGLLYRRRVLSDTDYGRLYQLVTEIARRSRNYVLKRYEMSGQFGLCLCSLPLAEVFRQDRRLPGSLRFARETIQQRDWALLARFWDQLLFPGLIHPKPVLDYFAEIVSFGEDHLDIAGFGKLSTTTVIEALPDSDILYDTAFVMPDERPESFVILFLLGTIGSMQLAHPLEVERFYQDRRIPAKFVEIAHLLASQKTMSTLRDHKMLSYFFNYSLLEFPLLRGLIIKTYTIVIDEAAQRGYREASSAELCRLFVRVVNEVLNLVFNVPQKVEPSVPNQKP